jgi:hypothetical protein
MCGAVHRACVPESRPHLVAAAPRRARGTRLRHGLGCRATRPTCAGTRIRRLVVGKRAPGLTRPQPTREARRHRRADARGRDCDTPPRPLRLAGDRSRASLRPATAERACASAITARTCAAAGRDPRRGRRVDPAASCQKRIRRAYVAAPPRHPRRAATRRVADHRPPRWHRRCRRPTARIACALGCSRSARRACGGARRRRARR